MAQRKMDEAQRKLEEAQKQAKDERATLEQQLQDANDKLRREVDSLRSSLDEWITKHRILEQDTKKKAQELAGKQEELYISENKNRELESRIRALERNTSHDIEQKEQELRQKKEEIANLRQQLVMNDKAKYSEIEDLKTQFEQRKKFESKDFEVRLSAERSAFETQLMQLEQKVEELQQNNETLYRDNVDLKNFLDMRTKELENLRAAENSNTSSKQQEVEDLRKQLEQYKKLFRVRFCE